MCRISTILFVFLTTLTLLLSTMAQENQVKKLKLFENGENILDVLSDKAEKMRFTVSNGLTYFRDGGKPALKMSTIGDIAKSAVTLYGDNVTHETGHHYALIQSYIFMLGLDTTTGFVSVYRSSNGTAWTKIKDWGAGHDESGSIWARENVLFVTYYDGVGKKYSYSSDYGATWSAAAAWSYAYPSNHWNFADALYVDVGTKILSTTDGYTLTDFWNYSTITPYELCYFEGFIYVIGKKDSDKTVSFGRLENGRYKELKSWPITNYDFGQIALGKTDDHLIISFPQRRRLQIFAYDLDSFYHIGDISDTTYTSVRVAGRNAAGDVFLLAANNTSTSYEERIQFQITNSLAVFKNRTWPSNYTMEDLIIFLNKEYWIGYDITANRVYLFNDDEGDLNSLSASVTLYTDYIEIGEHIPIGLRLHHSGGMAETGLRQNVIIESYLDLWGDALGLSLGTFNVANENIARAGKLTETADAWSEYDAAAAMMATNFRFNNNKIHRGDRVWFSIQLLADTEEFLTSPTLYSLDYIYQPADFGKL